MVTAPLTPWPEPTTAEAFLWGIYNNIEVFQSYNNT